MKKCSDFPAIHAYDSLTIRVALESESLNFFARTPGIDDPSPEKVSGQISAKLVNI